MLLKLSFLLMCWNLEFCELKQHFTREPDNQVDMFFPLARSPLHPVF